jgi:hypothetical protein
MFMKKSIPGGMNGMKMVWMVQIWYGWCRKWIDSTQFGNIF